MLSEILNDNRKRDIIMNDSEKKCSWTYNLFMLSLKVTWPVSYLVGKYFKQLINSIKFSRINHIAYFSEFF